jgi:hypothetical protein
MGTFFFAVREFWYRYWYKYFLILAKSGEEEDPMSRHAGTFTQALLAGAVCLAGSLGVSALAADASPPNFAPDPGASWFAYKREFIAPPSGPGPVMQHPKYPRVSNDDYRVTGQQPTFAFADLDNPILQPWARDVIRKQNELVLSGKPAYSRHASCYPVGIPHFLLMPMTRPMYFIQGPKEVVMILTSFSDVRRVHLNVPHSINLKPSWTGESVGHYEGDTLVVDTIGLSDKAPVDGFETPHTEQLHVVERWRLIDGETLEGGSMSRIPALHDALDRHPALQPHRGIARRTSVASVAMLARGGPLLEAICGENPGSLMGLESILSRSRLCPISDAFDAGLISERSAEHFETGPFVTGLADLGDAFAEIHVRRRRINEPAIRGP